MGLWIESPIPLESLLGLLSLHETDFTAVNVVFYSSFLLLLNITLDICPAMTAATSTPSSLSMQDLSFKH